MRERQEAGEWWDSSVSTERVAETETEFIYVLLRPRVVLAVGRAPVNGVATVLGEEYEVVSPLEFMGFYDWLRSPAGDVIGVRLWPLEEAKGLLGVAEKLISAAVRRKIPYYVELYFGSERCVHGPSSDDQGFGTSEVLRCRTREEYGIRFDVGWLNETELLALKVLASEAERGSASV